jgi:ribonucleoside-diphosphate reductase beta chain
MSKKLFDQHCPVGQTTTGIIHGKTSGVINLNGIKYQWAYNLWEQMLNNTWFAKEVDLTKDATQYLKLIPSEKRMYDKVLAQLIFMDGVQTNNSVDNVNEWITAPEVNMCIVRQAMEEALHSQSYAVMVDSLSANTEEIYEMWRRDEKLFAKNKHILDVYEKYGAIAESDDEAKVYMIVANQCLEGIYFYSGFAAMYSLARSGKMIGSSQMIKFIQRDEKTHLALFKNIFNTMRREFPDLFTDKVLANVKAMFEEAVRMEIEWGKYITQEGILGLSPALIEKFVKYLANQRMADLKLPLLYPEIGTSTADNPLPWFDSFSAFNDQKTNFFEGNVSNYSKGSLEMDF